MAWSGSTAPLPPASLGVVAGGGNALIGLGVGSLPAAPSVVAALVVGAPGYGASMTLWVAGAREPVTTAALGALTVATIGVALVCGSGHQHEHLHLPVAHDHEHSHDDGHHEHGHSDDLTGRHQHTHVHDEVRHGHPHVPDLHHRHVH